MQYNSLQYSLKAPENLTKNYAYLTYTSIFINEEISSRRAVLYVIL